MMKDIAIGITVACFLALSAQAQQAPAKSNVKAEAAQNLADLSDTLKISKGALIEISSYDETIDVYEIIIVKEPGVGPNYTSLKNLYQALGSKESFSKFKANKNSLVGSEFTLAKELRLLDEMSVDKRRAAKTKQ